MLLAEWLVAMGFLNLSEEDTLRWSPKWCQHRLRLAEAIFYAVTSLFFWSERLFPNSNLWEILKNAGDFEVTLDIQPRSGLKTVLKLNFVKGTVLKHLTFHLHVSKRPRSVEVCSFPHSTSSGPETISLVWNVSHRPSPRHMAPHFSVPTSQQRCKCPPICVVSE